MIKKTKKNGFSLFELLVSISIIGILTALASIAYSGTQKKARDARRIEDIKLIQNAAEQYYSLNLYKYPVSYTPGSSWSIGESTILESYPSDPKGSDYGNYSCIKIGESKIGCDDFAAYCVCAKMENKLNANASDTCNFSVAADDKTHYCAKNQQ